MLGAMQHVTVQQITSLATGELHCDSISCKPVMTYIVYSINYKPLYKKDSDLQQNIAV